ncbi:MAG: preprotein translocase subunit YajC [Pseudobutyrivibrio sp.]|nr:preprotein translocase subunit YajC [Pseudobutyrivibrio sp.]
MNILMASAMNSSLSLIIWVVVLFVFMYFFMIRPQQKEQKEKTAMMSSLAIGDTVLTTSGFYGVVIAIPDDTTVIVEFGSNKNCRIPMQKAAVAQVEKPEDAVKSTTSDVEKK